MAICVGRNAIDGTYVIAEGQDPPRGHGVQRGPRPGAPMQGEIRLLLELA